MRTLLAESEPGEVAVPRWEPLCDEELAAASMKGRRWPRSQSETAAESEVAKMRGDGGCEADEADIAEQNPRRSDAGRKGCKRWV